jgi:hypothetical protein
MLDRGDVCLLGLISVGADLVSIAVAVKRVKSFLERITMMGFIPVNVSLESLRSDFLSSLWCGAISLILV